MDVNGTRSHVLLGKRDWRQRLVPDPEHPEAPAAGWDATRKEVTLREQLFSFPPPPGDRLVTPVDRRGADQDRFATTYWIDRGGTAILAASHDAEVADRFWPSNRPPRRRLPGSQFAHCAAPPARAPERLAALAVTTRHVLVAGTLAPAGLLAFDLQAGGAPQRSVWPAEVGFVPFDVAALPDGGVAILDRDNRRLWLLDEHLRVRSPRAEPDDADPATGDFEPVSGAGPLASVPAGMQRQIATGDSFTLAGVLDPVAIVAPPDGSLLILDRRGDKAPSLLHRYRDGAPAGDPIELADADLGVALVGHDIALDRGTLYVADDVGNQAYAFTLGETDGVLTLDLLARYHPMRGFGGSALVAGPRGVWYDHGERWVPLVPQCMSRFATSAWLVTSAPFDGREPGCVWHRLFVDAWIPPSCRVEIWSRAADDARILPSATWEREPDPLPRGGGPDRPYLRQPDPYSTWELLFQRARGRYLDVRMHLVGDGRTTPHLHSLRVLYPRFSYLENYLPRLYRADPESASFLDRFLANAEGIETALEDRILAARVLLDPRAAPAEALEWLAEFFDVALDPTWGEARRRIFIAHAMDFFRWRGTPRGLRMALRLALDPEADDDVFAEPESRCSLAYRIVERYRLRTVPPAVAGDPTQELGPRPLTPGRRWTPVDGGAALAARYGAFLGSADPVPWPLRPPAGTDAAAAWQAFTDAVVGFRPAGRPGSPADAARWRAFLIRRYRTPLALSAAYGSAPTSFGEVPLPVALPPDGAALRDWFQFQAIVQAMHAAAHRFTVLLPADLGEEAASDPVELARRDLAHRIVELQKPAHTVFDVRLYWSAFRVGAARLGEDTTIGLGSRSPKLLRPAVLGQDALGETRLAGDPPPQLTRPPSIGRRPPPPATGPEAP
jgi:phage tail-like protein